MWRQHSWEMVACEMKEEWSPEKGRLRETGLLFPPLKDHTVCRRVSAALHQYCGWRAQFTATTCAARHGDTEAHRVTGLRCCGDPVEQASGTSSI